MACRMGPGRGGGAQHAGRWIHGDTWDLTEKTHVRGKVMWPEAQFAITETRGRARRLAPHQGQWPAGEDPTGTFPVSPDDPAFQIDRNPNSIEAQNIVLTLPAEPRALASAPSCVPMGMIGVALNGVAIFNALDDGGRDAVAHEVQDLCNGHPQMRGEYHYHGPSPCLPGETGDEKLIGYALDGFGIYSIYDANGTELTDADLDACHGRVSPVMWNGKREAIYHYVLTREYPYTIGCFSGTPVRLPRPQRGPGRFRRGPATAILNEYSHELCQRQCLWRRPRDPESHHRGGRGRRALLWRGRHHRARDAAACARSSGARWPSIRSMTGTAANSLALATLCPPHGAIFCHDESHIAVDECAAPEFFTHGAKLVPLKGAGGKITAEAIAAAHCPPSSAACTAPSRARCRSRS